MNSTIEWVSESGGEGFGFLDKELIAREGGQTRSITLRESLEIKKRLHSEGEVCSDVDAEGKWLDLIHAALTAAAN